MVWDQIQKKIFWKQLYKYVYFFPIKYSTMVIYELGNFMNWLFLFCPYKLWPLNIYIYIEDRQRSRKIFKKSKKKSYVYKTIVFK